MFSKNFHSKKIITAIIFFSALTNHQGIAQNIGINNPTPDASSLLDLTSTSKGFLVPRMTTAQLYAIPAPANGLLVYNTSLSQFYYYDGTQWRPIFTSATGWSLLGNAGTTPSTNFIGTTDNQPLSFRVNNTKAGIIDNINANTSLGVLTLYNNTTGTGNVASGDRALYSNTTGFENTAIGNHALYTNSTGYYNTASGTNALYSNSTGTNNTAYGNAALFSNTTGFNNTASGAGALNSNTTGNENTASGHGALSLNNTGSFNTANGSYALFSNTTGYSNTANGWYALYSNVAGSNATAVGYNAMYYANNTSASFTNYNVAVGYEALKGSTTPANNTGNYNTSLGYQTLYSNTTGYNNTANGFGALYSNTMGYNNTVSGLRALYSNTTGYYNTASGVQALYFNTTGNFNTASGLNALYSNTTGNFNTASGLISLYSNTTGYQNTAEGPYTLFSNTTGFNNTANGFNALNTNTTGNENSAFGYQANVSAGNLTNATALGSRAYVGASNSLVLGSISGVNGASSSTSVGIGTTNPSHARLQVQGMTGNTVAYFSGSANSQGISMVSDWPGIYFNSYYYWAQRAMGAYGFPAIIQTDQSAGGIIFNASNTPNTVADAAISIPERMRITGAGNVGIGTSNPQTTLHIGSGGTLRIDDGSGARFAQLFHSTNGNLHIDAVGGGSTYINWYGGPALYVGNGGAWYGPVFANAFYAASSARFKKDIVNTRYGLAEILNLQAKEYKYIEDKTGRNQIGLMAEDVEKIIPEVVYRSAEDNQVMGIDYGKLSPVIIEAIKEQQKMIEDLKLTADVLKKQIDDLKGGR